MRYLMPDPDLFDVAAWQARLAELRADPPDDFREGLVEYVLLHLAAITPPAEADAAPPAERQVAALEELEADRTAEAIAADR